MGTSGSEIRYGPSFRGPNDPTGFGGDQTLMVHLGKQFGLHDLCFHQISHHGNDRFIRIHDSPLRESIHISVETKTCQILQEALIKQLQAPEILDVLRFKMDIFDIFDDLLQSGKNRKASLIRVFPVEHIKRDLLLGVFLQEITVCHGQLVEVHHHCDIACFILFFHFCLLPGISRNRTSSGSSLQNLFHPDLLGHETAFLIKLHCAFVAVPDVQSDIIKPVFPRIVQYILIQLLPDMLSAAVFIHTEIIYVQRPNVREDIISEVFLIYTEGISQHFVILIRQHKNRPPVIPEDFLQLFCGIFCRRPLKKIRPAVVMDHTDLY